MAFDWRSRLCWIGRTDSGVVRQRLYDRNITGLGLSVLDPGAALWAKAIREEGRQPFFYTDPHWFGLADDGRALTYRQMVDADLERLALPGEMLMLDLEFVSPEYLRRLLFGASGNRGLVGSHNTEKPTGTQAGRPIAYTNMPFQNHTVVDMQAIWDAGLHWYYQMYYGDMAAADGDAVQAEINREMRAWATNAWATNVHDAPVNFCERVHPFYDGKRIADDQRDGSYFTAERIPGVFSTTAFHPSMEKFVAAEQRVRPEDTALVTKDSLRTHYTQLAKAA